MRNTDILISSEKEHYKISYEAACESITLLKNDGTLPLRKKCNIALYGAGAEITLNGGTGSGEVNSRYNVSIKEGLEKAGFKITTSKWLEDYKKEYESAMIKGNKTILKRLLKLSASNLINIIEGTIKYPFGRLIADEDVKQSNTDVCVYVIGRQSGEAKDRSLEEYELNKIEKENIEFILKNYKKVVVVINAGASIEMNWVDKYPDINSIIYYGQPGMEGGKALADILCGDITPSGKLVDTWYNNYCDIPFYDEYGQLSENIDEANYKENIYVGYRYIDSFNKKAAYYFGEGLSYTNFKIDLKDIKVHNSIIEISVNVQNVGNIYSGKEIVQVYLNFPNDKVEREYQCLVAYAKTDILKPGEMQLLNMKFDLRDSAYYDVNTASYFLEKGKYTIRIGNSSKNTKKVAYLDLIEDVITEKCMNICPLNICFNMLRKLEKTKEVYNENIPCFELKKDDFIVKINDYKTENISKDVKKIVDGLSFTEKIDFVVGSGVLGTNIVPGAYSTTEKYKDVGCLIMSDGPSGLRIHQKIGISKKNKIVLLEENYKFLQGLPKLVKKIIFANPSKVSLNYQFVTSFASPSTLAHSWNISLVNKVGKAVGEEMEEYGISYLLGPAINIHRNPLCGRNFEYISEDPLLTGKMAGAFATGLQEVKGRYVVLKHFAANNQETRRMYMTSNLDERTLREIYLKPFQIAIKEANVKGIMTSYNKINGVYTCNSQDLCKKVLRNEFGFKGIVMTDWLSTGKGLASNGVAIKSGNDLIMPGGKYYKKSLIKDYKKGLFTIEDLDRAVGNIIGEIIENK